MSRKHHENSSTMHAGTLLITSKSFLYQHVLYFSMAHCSSCQHLHVSLTGCMDPGVPTGDIKHGGAGRDETSQRPMNLVTCRSAAEIKRLSKVGKAYELQLAELAKHFPHGM